MADFTDLEKDKITKNSGLITDLGLSSLDVINVVVAFGGKLVDISDVIAQGSITDIQGKNITIRSNSNNLLIYRKAKMQAKKSNAKVKVKVF